MPSDHFIISIDQGTTSSRAMVFDTKGQVVAKHQQEFKQYYPHPGWVEHDPEEIWQSTLNVTKAAIEQVTAQGKRISAIGITNQRETTIVWERETGKPIGNAIVWQDRRTAEECEKLKKNIDEKELQSKSGLLLDPYFSATKIAWLLDNTPGARQAAEAGKLAFGTIDSFLIWRLTMGRSHVTDITNACRTNLLNIHHRDWDSNLLKLFDIPETILPKVLPCTADFGVADASWFDYDIPILGVAGDQQAATIGQCCFEAGDIKSTYGTGCFVVANTGETPLFSQHRLLTTVAYDIHGCTHYALEGSIFNAGSTVQWLRDGLGIIKHAKETQTLAASCESNDGVYLVPAFTGLGAPWWDPAARAAIFGITRATGPAQLARAALEAVCYQTNDLMESIAKDGITSQRLRVDGGMIINDWLAQFLSDILNIPVDRPVQMETTALGAAYLAGLQAGIFDNMSSLAKQWQCDQQFQSQIVDAQRQSLLAGWKKAVRKVLSESE